MTDSHSLSVERVIPGTIDDVFDAWLDPAQLSRWMTPGASMSVPVAEVDPRVGGRFYIVMRASGRDIPHEGEYRVIERPTRLVFTWNSEPAGRDTLVTVTFMKVAERETRVHLTHERFASAAARDSHRNGWGAILDSMAGAFRE
jgi:uncharacterized protein YndB with AHSA1/START domain